MRLLQLRSPAVLLLLGLIGAALGVVAAASPARADRCFDLWYQRNTIYANYDYCFKTADAQKYWPPHPGCNKTVHLSNYDQRRVNAIVAQEKALGCR